MNIIIKDFMKVSMIWGLIILSLLLVNSNAYSFTYKGLDMQVQGTIAEMFDDNLTFTKKDKKGDLITTLGLGLNINYEGKKRFLNFGGQINEGFNARFKDIKTSTQSLNLSFQNEFSQFDRITLSGTFSHSQTPASFEEEFVRVKGRREAYDNSFNLGYTKEINKYLTLQTSYSYSKSLFPAEEEGNTSQYGLGLNVRYLSDDASEYSLLFNYTKNNAGNVIYDAGLSIKKNIYISEKSFFTGGLGFSGNKVNDINLNINISFVNEIDENTLTSIAFNMSDKLTSEGGDIFRSWQITGQFKRELSWRLNFSSSVFYGKGTFSSTDITNTLMGLNLELFYLIREDLKGFLKYSFSNLDSSDENAGYYKNIVSTGFNWIF